MKPNEPITLDWEDFRRPEYIKHIDLKTAGVYIWGFTINRVFIPYYVGSSTKIAKRMVEHISSIIGGEYRVFEKDKLHEFPKLKNKGELYESNLPYGYLEFLKKRANLQPHIDFMVDTFTFTYAIVNSKNYDKGKDLEIIEKKIIKKIGIHNLINGKAGDTPEVTITHTGNEEIVKILN